MMFHRVLCAVAAYAVLQCHFSVAVQGKLEVIGTGFGRTGTDSLKEALNLLGYKTYHMKEIIFRYMPDHLEAWTYLIDNDCKVPKAKELFEEMFNSHNYTAAIGITAFCAETLSQVYPNAKMVHTERKSAEQWHSSVVATICTGPSGMLVKLGAKVNPLFRNLRSFINSAMRKQMVRQEDIDDVSPQMCMDHKQEMMDSYDDHNAKMKRVLPRKRLLVIQNHGDGWGPLCKFLGKSIPDEPFPHANSRTAFRNMVSGLVQTLLLKIMFPLLLVVAVVAYYLGNKRANTKIKTKTT